MASAVWTFGTKDIIIHVYNSKHSLELKIEISSPMECQELILNYYCLCVSNV
jgi:hypothetical protein